MNTEINWNDFQDIAQRIKSAIRYATDLQAQEVWGNLMENSPQKHGRLAGSWKLNQQGDMMYMIGTSVAYAAVMNDGSDPYEIFPRNASALRFEIGGQVIFAKRVKHPGIRGTGYIDRSIEQAENRGQEFIEMALDSEGLT
mgnify:CR=1 FL=1